MFRFFLGQRKGRTGLIPLQVDIIKEVSDTTEKSKKQESTSSIQPKLKKNNIKSHSFIGIETRIGFLTGLSMYCPT